jgi:hypothetical protein
VTFVILGDTDDLGRLDEHYLGAVDGGYVEETEFVLALQVVASGSPGRASNPEAAPLVHREDGDEPSRDLDDGSKERTPFLPGGAFLTPAPERSELIEAGTVGRDDGCQAVASIPERRTSTDERRRSVPGVSRRVADCRTP